MLTQEQFKDRANKLYEDCRTRWRKRLEKGLPKNVKLNLRPDEILPFDRLTFQKWLWRQLGLQAIPCPYCREPIDILSMELDHKTPLRRGGGPELSNLQCISERCNKVKGDLTHEEFEVLLVFMQGPGAQFRQRLEGLLINGHVGKMMRHFPKAKKKPDGVAVPKKTQDSLNFQLGAF